MVINVHAGHNPDGRKGSGAVGLIRESTENRIVKNLVIHKLQALQHLVYDCTEDNGINQQDVLEKIVTKCNAHEADLDIAIHFNAGRKDHIGDGNTGGTEIYVYNKNSKALPVAKKILANIVALGYRNRGIKYGPKLYVLRKTKAPAMLIECCFVDDRDDTNQYNAEEMAAAIVHGITGFWKESEAEMVEQHTEPLSSWDIFILGMQYRLALPMSGQDTQQLLAIAPTVSAEINRHHAVVTPLERYLKALGYYSGKIEADEGKTPIFGSGMTRAVNRYQREVLKYKKTDGEITAGKKMWKTLLKM